LFKLAAEEGLIDHIPVVKLYREDNARERVLSFDEYRQLFAAGGFPSPSASHHVRL